MRKSVLCGILFATIFLLSVHGQLQNLIGTPPVKAQDTWIVISSNDARGLSDGFQPVQVVWQPNYTASLDSPDRMGDMDFTSYGTSQLDVEWTARLPMVLGKDTYLFGAISGSRFIWLSVRNFHVDVDEEFRFKFTVDGTELGRSGWYKVKGATKDEYGYVHPGGLYCPIQAPFPVQPFRFKKAGPAQIEVTLDPPINRNKFIVHVNVKDTHGLYVLYVPIRFDIPSNQNIQPCVTREQLDQMTTASTNFINGTYPVAGDEIKGTPNWPAYYVPYIGGLVTFGKPPTDEEGEEGVKRQVRTILKTLDKYKDKAGRAGGPYDRIVGVLPRDWIKTYWGKYIKKWAKAVGLSWTRPGANPCPIVLVEEGWPTISAHEIGHTYGLPTRYYWDGEEYSDTVTGCPASGYWVKENLNMSKDKVCFMGWGWLTYDVRAIQNWVDKGCFRYLLTKFAGGDPEILYVSGWISKNNTASFEDVSRLPYGTPDVMLGAAGNYSIALLDESGTIIAQAGFNVTFTGELDVEFDPILVGLGIPWVNGTRQIQIRNATDVLASKNVSLNPSTVTVKFPNGGEILEPNATYTITWEASDPDGDPLTYSVLYSNDNGSTWLPLAMDIQKTSYDWNTTGFPSGSENLIKIIATDGVNTGEDVSNGTFTIRQSIPVGGVWVPVDKFVLLAPYIALASTILVATAATTIYVKRRNKKQ